MKVYTKTGDEGITSLIGGMRVSKSDVRIEAYGTLDELNSYIGYLSTYEIPFFVLNYLEQIQNILFNVGAHLASGTVGLNKVINNIDILQIEEQIDLLSKELPELTQFILPRGSKESTVCHICRTIVRRAERRVVEVLRFYTVEKEVVIFLNRLSDYFFVLSRYFFFVKIL